MWYVNLFTALNYDVLCLSLLCDGVHSWFYVFHATELLISVKRVIVKDWCKTSPFSVMTLLFIGPYFISSSVSGKSFPHGTVDTIIFIYSVYITHGQLSDLSAARAKNTDNCTAFGWCVVCELCWGVCVCALACVVSTPTSCELL